MKHIITNADPITRRGTCSICGPVALKPNRDGWRCWDAVRAYRRRTGTKSRGRASHRLTADQMTILRDQQAGLCAICSEMLNDDVCIDHDHHSGAVRGLLCRLCNLGLGHFMDDPVRLRAAIAYLARRGPHPGR